MNFLNDLRKVALLNEKVYRQLLDYLEKHSATLVSSQIAKGVPSQIPSIEADDASDIVRSLVHLCRLIQSEIIDSKTVVERVAELPDEDSVEINQSELSERLSAFLEKSSLQITAKASNIMTSYPQVFEASQIITDIRPIFYDESKEPVAAVITHTLKLGMWQSGERKDFFITLDSQDLDTLKQTIVRAEEKGERLSSIIKESTLTYLSLPND